jgi:hypothetical protein
VYGERGGDVGGGHEGKRPRVVTGYWVYNIKMGIKETGWNDMDRPGQAQVRVRWWDKPPGVLAG